MHVQSAFIAARKAAVKDCGSEGINWKPPGKRANRAASLPPVKVVFSKKLQPEGVMRNPTWGSREVASFLDP